MNILNFPHYLPTFRGKTNEGKWVEGLLSFHKSEFSYIVSHGVDTLVRSNTVSIATGLKDTNDKMIYEGDILDFNKHNILVYWNSEVFQWKTYLLDEDRDKCDAWYSGSSNPYDASLNTLGWVAAEVPILGSMSTKIIGNKWDNPELIPEHLRPHPMSKSFQW